MLAFLTFVEDREVAVARSAYAKELLISKIGRIIELSPESETLSEDYLWLCR